MRLLRPALGSLFLALVAAIAPAGPAPARAQTLPTEGYRLVDTWTTRDPVTTVPSFKKPGGVDVASDNTIYAVDSQLRQVYQLTASGQVIRKWSVDAAVGVPLDVAVSVDRVYVLGDTGGEVRSRIGALLRTFTVSNGQGIAVGLDRRVYVSRLVQTGGVFTGVIEVRDVDGAALGTPWQSDTYPMRTVFGIDVGADGRVYIATDGAVYVFQDADLRAILRVRRAIEGPDVTDVAVDDRGRVYGALGSQSGTLVAWKGVTGTQGEYLGDVFFNGARWLATGPGASLVVAVETTNFSGLSLLPDRDDFTGQPLRWGEATDTLGQVDAPRRLATSSSGDVFIVDRSERVQRWSVLGSPSEQWDASQVADVLGGGAQPCTIRGNRVTCFGPSRTVAWDEAGPTDGWLTAAAGNSTRLAVVDLANQRLALYRRDGSDRAAPGGWPLDPTGSFTVIADVALDEQHVYLVNRGTRRVDIRDLTGRSTGTLDVPGEALRVATGDGHLYALTRDGWVYKYDATGTLKAAFEAAPGGSPGDLAAGPAGRVYVADYHLTQVGGKVETVSRVLVYEPGGSPPTKLPEQPNLNCVVTTDKRAAPDKLYVGEEIAVQLRVLGSCPIGEGQVDVALIIDQSGSMSGTAIAASQAAAIAFLGELNPRGAQVALVAFSTTATVLQPLTSDLRGVVRSVSQIVAGGTTNYTDAMTKALGELTGPASRRTVPHIAVMMTDGNPTDRTDVMTTAARLKAAGITLYTIGLGADLDRDLLTAMASKPNMFYEAPTETELAKIYTEIGRQIGATRLLRTATVVDELPADMDLVPGSPFPNARVNGRILTWDLVDVPITGQSLIYRVKPSQAGRRPTNVSATLDYVDSTARPGQVTFPVPQVTVLKRSVWQVQLPYLSKNRCRPQRADVVLVFDTSNSMLEASGDGSGRTKRAAAIAAGRAFLDNMSLPGDQAAIVAFNASASLVQPLTGSRAALLQGLYALPSAGGTRIDLGLNQAMTELLSARHERRNTPVIVVLTDGLPTPGSESGLRTAARSARSMGFALFTIGLGTDADMALLRELSGDARRTFYAPNGAALLDIYNSIAGQALCD